MLLAIDVGNTNTVLALFKGGRMVREYRLSTRGLRLPKIRRPVDRVIVASVVPLLNRRIRKMYGRKTHFVTAGSIAGIKVKLKNKSEVGADRVVNALAAFSLFGGPAVVVDFGTATTFDLISKQGEYLGGAIAPGINLAAEALYHRTAKLPKIKIKAPKSVIGKNTREAMQSGLVIGYAAMVEGMVNRIKSKIPACRQARQNPKSKKNPKSQVQNSKIKVIATGGLAKLICKYTVVVDKIDAKLTLKGLQMIGEHLRG